MWQPNTACTGQVRGFARTFGEAAPNGGFGVWWLCPPNPALAGNAPAVGRSLAEQEWHLIN